MNALRNNVQLIGNIGKKPEIIVFENGRKLAKFNLATKEYFRGQDGQMQTETQWHSIVAWGKQADIIERFFKPGQKLTIEGKLRTRSYESKSGEMRTKTEIHIEKMLMLMKSKMNQTNSESQN